MRLKKIFRMMVVIQASLCYCYAQNIKNVEKNYFFKQKIGVFPLEELVILGFKYWEQGAPVAAYRHFMLAAQKNHAKANLYCGICCELSLVGILDLKLAAEYYRRAVDLGENGALYYLAMVYLKILEKIYHEEIDLHAKDGKYTDEFIKFRDDILKLLAQSGKKAYYAHALIFLYGLFGVESKELEFINNISHGGIASEIKSCRLLAKLLANPQGYGSYLKHDEEQAATLNHMAHTLEKKLNPIMKTAVNSPEMGINFFLPREALQ